MNNDSKIKTCVVFFIIHVFLSAYALYLTNNISQYLNVLYFINVVGIIECLYCLLRIIVFYKKINERIIFNIHVIVAVLEIVSNLLIIMLLSKLYDNDTILKVLIIYFLSQWGITMLLLLCICHAFDIFFTNIIYALKSVIIIVTYCVDYCVDNTENSNYNHELVCEKMYNRIIKGKFAII